MNLDLMHGLRVVESSAFIAAPMAGLTLAQFGADVIRIDAIGGGIDYARLPMKPGGRSLYWTGLNKGKRSLAVDIRSAAGRELVRGLATAPGPGGGVLLTNIGTPWLAHASLAALRPDLVSCTIEGNPDGSTAVDYTVNCAAGFPAITGAASGQHPVNHVLPAWDIACAYQAAFAIAAAVGARARSGQGAELRLALSDIAFSTLSHLGMLAEAQVLRQERQALGNYIYGAFGRDYRTRDGRGIFVAAISLSQWRSLVAACELAGPIAALERELGLDFDAEAGRFAARERISPLVEAWCTGRSYDALAAAFDAHRVCWGPYQTVMQALDTDPRLSERNPIFASIDTAGVGIHLAAGSAVRHVGAARGGVEAAPVLGQHTDEILEGVLGLGTGEIGRLHDQGVVAGPASDPLMRAAA